MWALAVNPDDAATLVHAGIVSTVCHSMARHQKAPHVQRAACEALAALCGAGQAAQQEAVEEGAVALVCAASRFAARMSHASTSPTGERSSCSGAHSMSAAINLARRGSTTSARRSPIAIARWTTSPTEAERGWC